MNAVTVDGKTVAQSCELVSRVGLEIDGLSRLLSDMITAALSKATTLPCGLAGSVVSNQRTDDSGWVYTDIAYSFPLKGKGKGKQKTELYISFQISLTGDGIAIPKNAEPLLHVYSIGNACDFEADYIGFPLINDEDEPFEIINDRLLFWGSQESSEWNKCGWAYSLRLMSLNSPEDLKRHVIEPMLALLGGESVLNALPDTLPALVKYPEKEQLIEIE